MRAGYATYARILVRLLHTFSNRIFLTIFSTIPLCRLLWWTHAMQGLHRRPAHVQPVPQDSGTSNSLLLLSADTLTGVDGHFLLKM